MKKQIHSLTTILLLLVAVSGVCAFLLIPEVSEAVGITLAGAFGCCAIHGQGERVMGLMRKAIRQKRVCLTLPIFRPMLNPAADVIGLPAETRLFLAVATPPTAPPFICSF